MRWSISIIVRIIQWIIIILFFSNVTQAADSAEALAYDEGLQLTAQEISWLQQHQEMTITGDPHWLPYEAFDEKGEYVGIVADYLKLLESKLHIRFKPVVSDSWSESIQLAKNGQIDMISETDGSVLKDTWALSDSYLSNLIVIVMRHQQTHVDDLDELKGLPIGIVQDYGYVSKIVGRYPGHEFRPVRNIQQGLISVSTGKVDALLCPVALCGYMIAELGLQNVKIVGKSDLNVRFKFALNPQKAEFLPILNKAIAHVSAVNRQNIMQKWAPKQYVEKTDYQLIIQISIGFLLIMSFWAYRHYQLKKYNQRLSESEARYARVVHGTSDGIWDWNLRSGRVYLSPRWKQLIGYQEDELSNQARNNFQLVHPDDFNDLKNSIESHLLGGEALDSDFRIRNKNGKYRWYRILGQAQFDQFGQPTWLAGSLSDITHKKLEESLKYSRNRVLELTAKGGALQDILDAIVQTVERENPQMLCSILLVDEKTKTLVFGSSSSLPKFFADASNGLPISDGNGSCGTAAFIAERVVVEDIQTHAFWQPYKELAAQAGLAACWSEPIIDSKGKVSGTFAIYHKTPCAPTAQDGLIIEQAATLAGIAIEKHRALMELQLASLVYQNSSEAMLIFDVENIVVSVNPAFSEITGFTADEVIGEPVELLHSDFYEPHFYQALLLAVEHTGKWQGEVKAKRKNNEVYYKWLTINTILDDAGKVKRRVALFSDITEQKKSEKIIWEQANYDSLTNLPNRNMFNDRLLQELKKAKRDQLQFALLLIDLDQFKEVNDTLGHAFGDLLLIEAAQRISHAVRDSDTVARLGGDEFTIIISELNSQNTVDRVADNILEKLALPFKLGDDSVYISASIGIALYPDDTTEFEGLLKSADQAMYQAKKNGRNCYQYFTQSMQQAAVQRMNMVSELRSAILQQQFCLHYQPIYELASERIFKAEALIRWQHPVMGLVPPNEFIALAEETGMIVDIGNWVFEQSAEQVAKWREHYSSQFQISVNTSPVQYQAHGIDHQKWIQIFDNLGLAGDAIIMEITEGLMMDASCQVSDQLIAFRNAGIQVALDDFGTGYSSLSYLKKFDIDYIKIDQSFVRNLENDLDNRALCEAIVVMAHKLNLKVIAEGVETMAQKLILTEMNCDFAQGYLFSRPIPAEQFEQKFFADARITSI